MEDHEADSRCKTNVFVFMKPKIVPESFVTRPMTILDALFDEKIKDQEFPDMLCVRNIPKNKTCLSTDQHP